MAAAGPWIATTSTRQNLISGNYAIGSHSYKIALFTISSNIGGASNLFSGVTAEVASGSWYTTGGQAVTLTATGTSPVSVSSTVATWSSAGGTLSAYYAVLYDVTSGYVLCYCLLDGTGATVTVNNANINVLASTVFNLS